MSIKKRLMLSNIAMIVLPIVGFLILEMILGYLFFVAFNGTPRGSDLELFIGLRMAGMIIILAVINGLLTYYVARSILSPLNNLSLAAKRIREGDLNHSVKSKRNDELGELSETFEAMRISLKEAEVARRNYEQNRQELIASISHDLATPLTSIKGYVNGIQDGIANTPEKLERYLDIIYKKADDMDALIHDLFLYSKLDVSQVPFDFEKIDLYAFFHDFIEEITFDLEEAEGSAALHASPDTSYLVEADREQLRRVVKNIIQNSLKYIDKPQKEIHVHLDNKEDEIVVRIQDNGSGIAPEHLPYLFESFYRTDTSRNSSTGGSGLGLAIVKKIIDQHGGKAWAESETGQGTSIYFTLKKVSK
ncbi:sensor histidine kinase [Thalassobacillus sp. B23F22_16]|uniref:sensor histidine kinase n=1 Tax=Thalassobacillus sp. B23F22_16 TaxID=3459513 RepID=UPI00373E734F